MAKIHRQNVVNLLFIIQCSSFAGEETSPLPGQQRTIYQGRGGVSPPVIFFSRMPEEQAVDFG